MGVKGNRTVDRKDYKKYIRSPEWRAKKAKYWASNAPKECYICGRTNRPMDLHHRTYKNLGNERLMDLVPVHRSCHDKIHEEHDLNPTRGIWYSTKRARKKHYVKPASKKEVSTKEAALAALRSRRQRPLKV